MHVSWCRFRMWATFRMWPTFSKGRPHSKPAPLSFHALIVKARFHYERGKEHSLFLLLIFDWSERVKLKQAQKQSIKQTKNALFHARSGNGPLRKERFFEDIHQRRHYFTRQNKIFVLLLTTKCNIAPPN